MLFLRRVSISSLFISENGIVAVPGDENQLVNGGIRIINRPLLFERGHIDQMWGSEACLPNSSYARISRLKIGSLLMRRYLMIELGPSCEWMAGPLQRFE